MPRGHFHTGPIDLTITAIGVIVVLHVLRAVAAQLVTHPATSGAGKVLAAFALSD